VSTLGTIGNFLKYLTVIFLGEPCVMEIWREVGRPTDCVVEKGNSISWVVWVEGKEN